MSREAALIVDDVPDLLQVMAEAVGLARPDLAVHTAIDAASADAVMADLRSRGEHLGLVITDQALGDRTGLELLEDLDDPGRVAKVLVTGRADASIAEQASSMGARVLWKPFRLTALLDVLQEVHAPPTA